MCKSDNIPKVIHYCWFGKGKKPDLIKECLSNWHTILDDYEIVEWNEENFDVFQHPYVKEAYEAKKYAFVSDYVRLYALYNFGGIYLDTDVKIYKKFDDLLHHNSFWGLEQENYIATSTIGAKKNNPLIKIFFEEYQNATFLNSDGSYKQLTNVAIISKIMRNLGLVQKGNYLEIEGVAVVYPQVYFSPYDYVNIRHLEDDRTYTKHYFFKSWLSSKEKRNYYLKKNIAKIISGENIFRIRKILKKVKGNL